MKFDEEIFDSETLKTDLDFFSFQSFVLSRLQGVACLKKSHCHEYDFPAYYTRLPCHH